MTTGFRNGLRCCCCFPRYLCYTLFAAIYGSQHWVDLWICGRILGCLGYSILPRAEGKLTELSIPRRYDRDNKSQGRSLEEVDELFGAKLWAWQFRKHETHGTGHLLTMLENEGEGMEKLGLEKTQTERIDAVAQAGEVGAVAKS